MNRNCPIHGVEGILVKSLSRKFLLSELSGYFKGVPPESIVACDYELRRCPICRLEYATPNVPGSAEFYNWIASRSHYYPADRWEFGLVSSLESADGLKVLDVGCGDGEFLEYFRDHHATAVGCGLDLSAPAVEKCRGKGFEAWCQSLEEFEVPAGPRFDLITSFHCLEHVADPRSFVSRLFEFLAPSGHLYLSTPLSPMSFEAGWFDIQNHPPHHMTRWNLEAYRALADSVGAKMEFWLPAAGSLHRRIKNAFILGVKGPNSSLRKLDLLKLLLRHPVIFLKVVRDQWRRKKLDGKVLPDVILVRFSRV